MIDNSIINIKRLGLLLHNEFLSRRLDFSILSSLISTNFSYYETSLLLANIISKDYDILNYEIFIKILSGFYNDRYHRASISDLKQILDNLQKINPELLYALEIEDFDKFLGELKSIKKSKQ